MVQLQVPGQNCPHVIREPQRVQHGQQGEQRRVQGVREPRLDRDRVVREAAVSARRIVYNKYLQEGIQKHSLDGLCSNGTDSIYSPYLDRYRWPTGPWCNCQSRACSAGGSSGASGYSGRCPAGRPPLPRRSPCSR